MTTPFPRHLRTLKRAMKKIGQERARACRQHFPPWYMRCMDYQLMRVMVRCFPVVMIAAVVLSILIGRVLPTHGWLSLIGVVVASAAPIGIWVSDPLSTHFIDWVAGYTPQSIPLHPDFDTPIKRRVAIWRAWDDEALAKAALDALEQELKARLPENLQRSRPWPLRETLIGRVIEELEDMRKWVREAHHPSQQETITSIVMMSDDSDYLDSRRRHLMREVGDQYRVTARNIYLLEAGGA